MEWILNHLELIALILMVADKVVTKTPNKYDDLIFTAIKGTLGALAGKKKT